MRYLSSLILVMLLAVPALANPSFCPMTGPQNCTVQDENKLIDLTRNTINHMQITQNQHPFRTQNDDVLSQAVARQHAQLQQPQQYRVR